MEPWTFFSFFVFEELSEAIEIIAPLFRAKDPRSFSGGAVGIKQGLRVTPDEVEPVEDNGPGPLAKPDGCSGPDSQTSNSLNIVLRKFKKRKGRPKNHMMVGLSLKQKLKRTKRKASCH
ncbi:hypothetical protein Ancab_013959 [Ancistrocladus abbreviatus]